MQHVPWSRLALAAALGLASVSARVDAQLAPAATTTAPSAARAPGQASDTRFLRFEGDGKIGGRLQTSDITYANDAGTRVRLVSAVHIGEQSYFETLNKSFAGCDAVLYELVKEKDAPPPVQGQQSDHPVARLQHFLKDTLGLSFQLDHIDYGAKNFVHADLDAATFRQLQSDRGESFATLMLSALMRSMSDPAAARAYEDEPADVIDLMTRPDGENQVKLLLARRLGNIEREAMGMDALDGTVILTERNKAAVKALQQSLKEGKKNLAIFYGAAHMPDLADRLELMGFKPVKTDWHTAWDVKIRPDAPSAFMKVMGRMEQSLQEPRP